MNWHSAVLRSLLILYYIILIYLFIHFLQFMWQLFGVAEFEPSKDFMLVNIEAKHEGPHSHIILLSLECVIDNTEPLMVLEHWVPFMLWKDNFQAKFKTD